MSILYPENSVEIVQGTTRYLDLAVSLNGTPVNLTGCSIFMTVRSTLEDLQPTLFKSITDGITITDAAGGLATIALDLVGSKVPPGVYIFDVVLVVPSGVNAGTHLIVPESTLEIKRGVTRI